MRKLMNLFKNIKKNTIHATISTDDKIDYNCFLYGKASKYGKHIWAIDIKEVKKVIGTVCSDEVWEKNCIIDYKGRKKIGTVLYALMGDRVECRVCFPKDIDKAANSIIEKIDAVRKFEILEMEYEF